VGLHEAELALVQLRLTPIRCGPILPLMRIFRFICALVLAASLAVLPVSAALAMSHVTKSDTSLMAPGDDCPCCTPTEPESCLKCCHVQSLPIEGLLVTGPVPARFTELGADRFAAVVLGPDPPPPRL
jgi:hypothetical protein